MIDNMEINDIYVTHSTKLYEVINFFTAVVIQYKWSTATNQPAQPPTYQFVA